MESPAASNGDFNTRAAPRLYQPHSADSIVHDFAYANKYGDVAKTQTGRSKSTTAGHGSAEDFYNDHGESVALQPGNRNSIALADVTPKPGIRRSIALAKMPGAESLPEHPTEAHQSKDAFGRGKRPRFNKDELKLLDHAPADDEGSRGVEGFDDVAPEAVPGPGRKQSHVPRVTDIFGRV